MIWTFIITIVVVMIAIRLLVVYNDKVKFFSTGSDNGFRFKEIRMLWRLAKMTELEDPQALYISVPTLNQAISHIITDATNKGIQDTPEIQGFLSKLYKFRTKLNIEKENKKGLESTKYLDKGQKLRIILHGKGVFTSEIVNNGYEIVIKLPLQNNTIKVKSDDWINQEISVYLWRKGDASYVFDTRVTNAGVFNGQTVIYLAQTNQLLRAQKRRSVRCECNLNAAMYFIKEEVIDFNMVETEPGYKVVLEDISEDGAMIRVGGQGIVNAQIKLQFSLGETIVLMYGIVRAVEYNKEINQSRLHFECIHLEEKMKNAILSYVYNVLPQEQKDIFDALSGTEEDMAADETASKEMPESSLVKENIVPVTEVKQEEIRPTLISDDETINIPEEGIPVNQDSDSMENSPTSAGGTEGKPVLDELAKMDVL